MRCRKKLVVVRVPSLNRVTLVRPLRLYPRNPTGPTRHEVRRDGWQRVNQGEWVPPGTDRSQVDQRILEAAERLGTIGAVNGWAALCWLGSRWWRGRAADGSALPVTLAATSIRAPRGAVVSKEKVLPGEMLVVDGIVVTNPTWSVTFEMRYAASVREAVVWFDMTAYDDLVSIEDVEPYLLRLTAWTGIPQLRSAMVLVDENSWSPQETRLRLVWVLDAVLPPPLCNRPVFDLEGHHLGTPDLLDPVAGLAVQYDGPDHLDPERRATDRAQDLRYVEAGLGVVRVTHADMQDRARLAVRLDEARTEALAHPAPRGWTLDLPAWWTPTHTVALRRALDADQQTRWLRYRRAG